ncbi:unnamed protein product [Amaranthus hypochondriacus]
MGKETGDRSTNIINTYEMSPTSQKVIKTEKDLMEDAISSSNGGLFQLSDLMDQLPIKGRKSINMNHVKLRITNLKDCNITLRITDTFSTKNSCGA